jgi:ubiquitin-like domain-containing CTD phosphatase 1
METVTTTDTTPDSSTEDGREINLIAKHLGSGEFMVTVHSKCTVGELKRKLEEITQVKSSRQKLVGLDGSAKKKIRLSDDFTMEQLEIKQSHRFTLIGTADANIIKDPHQLEGGLPTVINDLDDDSTTISEEDVSSYIVQDYNRNLRELKKRLDDCQVHLINEPRRGKKLCVIDIDYTIFDCKATHNYGNH